MAKGRVSVKTIRIKSFTAAIFLFFVIGLPAFITGWVVAVNFSGVFETGYKMAFFDIKSALKESIKDGQPFFYMNGIKIYSENFTENSNFQNNKQVHEDKAEKKEYKKKAFTISYDIRN